MTIARALVAELGRDPEALAELRTLLEVASPRSAETTVAPPAFTVSTLAAYLGRSERAIRDAIGRGELAAVKRGRGYVISADAVTDWATAPPPRRRTTFSKPPRPRHRTSTTGPARRALQTKE